MDKELLDKLIKYHGLDFCEHQKQRMYCPECMWDVPTIYRNEREKFLKEKTKQEKPLTSLLGCDIKK